MRNAHDWPDVPNSPSTSSLSVRADDLLKQLDRIVDAQVPTQAAAEGLNELREWMAEEKPSPQEQFEQSALLPGDQRHE
ncbi:hypothetical protein OOK29_48465, partial [Streptomyces phaeochromogenes]